MHIEIYVDGGTILGNPSTEGVYWSVVGTTDDGVGDFLISRRSSRAYRTNNEAEYLAVIDALTEVYEREPLTATIHCDSRMVVQQMNGVWKVKNARIAVLYALASSWLDNLRDRGTEVHIVWVPREENVERLGH
jgi:ribonuclease HI